MHKLTKIMARSAPLQIPKMLTTQGGTHSSFLLVANTVDDGLNYSDTQVET